jgi:hypothetical protein
MPVLDPRAFSVVWLLPLMRTLFIFLSRQEQGRPGGCPLLPAMEKAPRILADHLVGVDELEPYGMRGADVEPWQPSSRPPAWARSLPIAAKPWPCSLS